MDITDEMYSAYRAGRHEHRTRDAHLDDRSELGGECCDRAGLERVASLIAAQALRQAAEEIRAELVCCDVYETVGQELQARNLAGENVEVSDETTEGHQICYWGEAAAMIVEPR